jgi:uncharacterized protein YdaU (DUF1376 family)
MPLYIADYLADTPHLDCAHSGAYLHLIMAYWQRGYLPNDDKKLASIARATPEQWASMKDTLVEFFTDGWKHKRIDDEIEKSRQAYERRALAGQKGGQSKASNATAMQEPGYSNALPTTITTTKEETPYKESLSNSCRKQVSTRETASRFYAEYPKHVGPENSAKAFEKRLKQGIDPEHIISAAIRFSEAHAKAGTEKKYIPAPAVWLNGGSYDDQDLPQPRAMNGNGHDPPITAYTRPSMGPVIQDLERKAAESRAKADKSKAEFEQWKRENE